MYLHIVSIIMYTHTVSAYKCMYVHTFTMAAKAEAQAFSMSCTRSWVQLLINLHVHWNEIDRRSRVN